MDTLTTLLPSILKESAFFFLLVGVLYWLLKVYIPSRDAAFDRQMQAMQDTFTRAMHDVTVNIGGEIKDLKIEIEKIRAR